MELNSNHVNAEIKAHILPDDEMIYLMRIFANHMLNNGSTNPFVFMIRDAVEEEMDILQKLGVLSGHIRGEYI